MSLAAVAKVAGVSKSTVSRVMNHSSLVSDETAKRVRRAAERVGYQPPASPASGGARRPRGGRLGVKQRRIAIVTLGQMHQEWLSVPVIGSFVRGVTAAAREFDVDVMLDDMPTLHEPSRLIQRGDIGGAILMVDSAATRSAEWMRAIGALAERLPVVWAMGGHAFHAQVDHVLPDNVGIGYMAAAYLSSRGCKRVASVSMTPQLPFSRQRLAMFACSAMDIGMEVVTYLATEDAEIGRFYPGVVKVLPSFEDVVEALTREGAWAEGLFVPRDHETARLYPILSQAGLRPGREPWLISCDNDTSQLSLLQPTPATIDLNTQEVARVAIRRLRTRMRHEAEQPVVVNVQPVLIEPKGPAVEDRLSVPLPSYSGGDGSISPGL